MSEEKPVELEQVPLKSDTDAPAETAETPAGEAAAPEAPAPTKKTWNFFKKTKKAVATEEPAVEGEEKPVEEKPKKKCFWQKCSGSKTETEQKEDHISIGINLVDRDEKNVNEHVNFSFADIFGEADSQHSADCVWKLIYKIFSCTRKVIYWIFAVLLGIPCAFVFGILFALFSVLNVFFCVPAGKLLSIPGAWLYKVWNWLIHAIFDPLATALGLVFSQFTVRKYGFNSQPTEPLV